MRHRLKTHEDYYQLIVDGVKTFEIRSIVDRNFAKGDQVMFVEINRGSGEQTNRECLFEITYVTSYNQMVNFVVFGIKPALELKNDV